MKALNMAPAVPAGGGFARKLDPNESIGNKILLGNFENYANRKRKGRRYNHRGASLGKKCSTKRLK